MHAAPALRLLSIAATGADPLDATMVLLLAAPRLTGGLYFGFAPVLDGAEAMEKGVIKLLCFEKAEWIDLRLGNLGLALPPSGVFAKLRRLNFEMVQLDGPCNLGDLLSSVRCPFLQYLHLFNVRGRGVSNLDIRSESLFNLGLGGLQELQLLTVLAPMLKELGVLFCFTGRQPVANITVPVLERLTWVDAYDPSSVQLGKLAQLQELRTLGDLINEFHNYPLTRDPVMLLQHFRKIPRVNLFTKYPPVSVLSLFFGTICFFLFW